MVHVAAFALWLAVLVMFHALARRVAGARVAALACAGLAALVAWSGTLLWAAGTQDLRPTTEEGWTTVRNNAVTLAEAGNLLMIVPRAVDGDEWMRLSQAMVDTAAAAARAAEAKDADKLFQAGADIYSVCTNCHVKYNMEIVAAEKK